MRTKSWEFPQFHWQSVYQPVAPSMSSGPLSILTVKKPRAGQFHGWTCPDRTVFGEDDRTQSVPFMLFRFKDGGFQRMGLGIDNQQSVFTVDSKNPVSNSDHRTDLSTVQTAGSILSPGNSLPRFPSCQYHTGKYRCWFLYTRYVHPRQGKNARRNLRFS